MNIKYITLFICAFISSFSFSQVGEKKIDEVNIIKKRTARNVIDLVQKKFVNNYKKKDTLTFYTEFSNKEEKLGTIYQLEGNLDLFFDKYLEYINHYYDSFIYQDTKIVNNADKLLDSKKENYPTSFSRYISPEIIYEIIKRKKQYSFSFLETNHEDVYTIKFFPTNSKSFMYEGYLNVDKKTFAILNFQTTLIEHTGNSFISMFGTKNDSYRIVSHQLQCSFKKNEKSFYQLNECSTTSDVHQKDNYNRKYYIRGNIKNIITPEKEEKVLFGIDGLDKYNDKVNR
ncbi:hypothetical protein [Bergeyella cardium]|uniref:hypothetical protein n=1 Tax=Bergeyella cardium TaxID=1585976 RepID=UPI000EA0BBDF|nr:hypothetical protein [Bergeyella cardium]